MLRRSSSSLTDAQLLGTKRMTNLYHPPKANLEPKAKLESWDVEPSAEGKKRLVVIAGLAFAVLLGFGEVWFEGYTAYHAHWSIITTLVGIALIATWVHYDAAFIGHRVEGGLWLGIVLFAIIALPYYYLRSRGFKRGVRKIGQTILYFILWSFVAGVSSVASQYILDT